MTDHDSFSGDTGAPRDRRRRGPIILIAGIVVTGGLITIMAMAVSANPQQASPLIGKPAPPISGPGINAGPQQLSSQAGKWVLINFFASWCIPCRQEMPELNRFAVEHATKRDAAVLGVEYDERDLGAAPGFLRQFHAAFAAIDDPSAEVEYGVSGIPETYLIDPEGTVVAKYFGAITAASIDREIAKIESPT